LISQRGEDPTRRIVVGVDGSPSSKAALLWALRQAELTGTSVDAVLAWHYPIVGAGIPHAPAAAMAGVDFAEIARIVLTRAITEVIDPASAVKISSTVAEGNAAQVLLEAADGADLLVVGSRGHGGFTGALLGSVSQHCAHHAPCPLVIVRGPGRRQGSEEAGTGHNGGGVPDERDH
jgi:nucleotide-binding universal stress UspA family protein